MKQAEAEASSAFRPVTDQGREEYRQSSGGEGIPAPEQGHSLVKVTPASAGIGTGKFVSQLHLINILNRDALVRDMCGQYLDNFLKALKFSFLFENYKKVK